jgi:hypothetical protein
MRELIELLNDRERQFLKIFLLGLCLCLVLLIFVLSWEKSRVENVKTELINRQKSLEQAQEARDKSQQLWRQWSEASRNLETLRENWYYQGEEGLRQMRLDLSQVMKASGLTLPPIQYSYQDLEKGKIKKVSFNFRLRASYFALRDLIGQLESFPKFLLLEHLDFQAVEANGGSLDLRLVVAGYNAY